MAAEEGRPMAVGKLLEFKPAKDEDGNSANSHSNDCMIFDDCMNVNAWSLLGGIWDLGPGCCKSGAKLSEGSGRSSIKLMLNQNKLWREMNSALLAGLD